MKYFSIHRKRSKNVDRINRITLFDSETNKIFFSVDIDGNFWCDNKFNYCPLKLMEVTNHLYPKVNYSIDKLTHCIKNKKV
jgi:hypothetical protein